MNLPQQDWVFAMKVQFFFQSIGRPIEKKKHWFFGMLDIYDFSCNLVVISTSKFFSDNKIAWARWASAICSLWMRFVVFFKYITMTYYRLEIMDDFGPENSYRFTFTMHFFTFLFAELMRIGWVVVPKKNLLMPNKYKQLKL